jgi:hypothetical protein
MADGFGAKPAAPSASSGWGSWLSGGLKSVVETATAAAAAAEAEADAFEANEDLNASEESCSSDYVSPTSPEVTANADMLATKQNERAGRSDSSISSLQRQFSDESERARQSVQRACPDVDMTVEGKPFAEEVFKYVDGDSAHEVIKAIAGVEELHRNGVSPSSVALHVAKTHVRGDEIAGLLPWLSPEDAAHLLQASLLDGHDLSRAQQVEMLAHLKEARHTMTNAATGLDEVIRQAEALLLLRTVFQSVYGEDRHFPLQIEAGKTAEVASSQWLMALRADPETDMFVETAEGILEEKGIIAF